MHGGADEPRRLGDPAPRQMRSRARPRRARPRPHLEERLRFGGPAERELGRGRNSAAAARGALHLQCQWPEAEPDRRPRLSGRDELRRLRPAVALDLPVENDGGRRRSGRLRGISLRPRRQPHLAEEARRQGPGLPIRCPQPGGREGRAGVRPRRPLQLRPRGLQTGAWFTGTGHGVYNAYDGFGRIASTTSNMGGTSRTLTYEHVSGGRRTRVTHPDGMAFGFGYDG